VKGVELKELSTHGAMQSLDFAGGGWGIRRGESVRDAVVQTDPIEEHDGRFGLVLAGKDATIEFLSFVKSR
jgi:hypothetical protein